MTSFATDIALLFTDDDVDCMGGSVELRDYAFMSDPAGTSSFADHGHANKVYKRLLPAAGVRRMPQGGPYWSDAQIALFKQWMDEGYKP